MWPWSDSLQKVVTRKNKTVMTKEDIRRKATAYRKHLCRNIHELINKQKSRIVVFQDGITHGKSLRFRVFLIQKILERDVPSSHDVIHHASRLRIVLSVNRVRMWQVHSEHVVQDIELKTRRTQVFEVLHLVVSVIRKVFVKQRRVIVTTEDHVRLLEVGNKTLDS